MITTMLYDYDSGTFLADDELISINAIQRDVVGFWNGIGLSIGVEDLKIVRCERDETPWFRPKERNPRQECDWITLSVSNMKFWCQVIFQFAHEFTHCMIYRLNRNEQQKIKWIEETICEMMSLVLLHYYGEKWNHTILGQMDADKKYQKSVENYLRDRLDERGTGRLSNCRGINELMEISRTSEGHREDRKNEMLKLFNTISSYNDITSLVHYKDYVVPGMFLLDTEAYLKVYPNNAAVRYLCELQQNAVG